MHSTPQASYICLFYVFGGTNTIAKTASKSRAQSQKAIACDSPHTTDQNDKTFIRRSANTKQTTTMLIQVSLLSDLDRDFRNTNSTQHLSRIHALLQEARSNGHPADSPFPCARREGSPSRVYDGKDRNTCAQSAFLQLQRDYASLLLKAQGAACAPGNEVATALEFASGLDSHLLCHGSEGYYITGELQNSSPLFDAENVLPGSWVGSCERLLSELVELAPVYGLQFRPSGSRTVLRNAGIELTKACAARLQEADPSQPEAAWFLLYDKVCQSLQNNTPLVLLQRSSASQIPLL